MIRSIAYEIFDRLTTDVRQLRFRIANDREHHEEVRSKLVEDCFALQRELADARLKASALDACDQCREQLALVQQQFAEYRDNLQTIVDEQLGPSGVESFVGLLTLVEDGLRKGSRAEAQLLLQRDKSDLTIEPTWVLALWSQMGEFWAEQERGSYDAMMLKMRAQATPWNLFSRSAWDALVKNGRAR